MNFKTIVRTVDTHNNLSLKNKTHFNYKNNKESIKKN